MFAIIKTGGKQYRISPGDVLKLEYLGLEKGSGVIFKDILFYENDGKTLLGTPLLENVQVKGKILENKADKKIIIFKKRRRHNSRRLNGHKQKISVVKINDILLDGKIVNSKSVPSTKKATAKRTIDKQDIEKNKNDQEVNNGT